MAVLEHEPPAVSELYRNAIDPRAFVDVREEGPSLQLRHKSIPGMLAHSVAGTYTASCGLTRSPGARMR